MPSITPEGDGLTTFGLTIMMLVVCWPTVIARYLVRVKKRALGLDDWLMGLGMIMTTAWSGVLIAYCYSGGGYDPTDPRITSQLLQQALKMYFICQSVYCPTTIPVKVSICVALLRIGGTVTVYRWSLFAIMAITAVSGIGSMAGIVASCSPPSAFWDSSAGTCNALINTTAAYFISACSILTDFALAILPGFMLWSVQMRRSVKVSVAIILGFAAFASCATIVRLRYLLALLDSQNFLKHSAKIAIWTVIELAIGIFAGSAPALRPLLKYIPFRTRSEADDYHESRGEASGHIRMETYESGTFAKSVRNPTDTKILGDGSSQEYILETHDGAPRGIEVRKDVSIKVESLNRPS
ncbi:hypothetical protein F66182_8468 [Fusarium sp. NRRL 66182]|nr:hypothetical protein F66182_8468 [Fusarium sp. NRRL 66182]